MHTHILYVLNCTTDIQNTEVYFDRHLFKLLISVPVGDLKFGGAQSNRKSFDGNVILLFPPNIGGAITPPASLVPPAL